MPGRTGTDKSGDSIDGGGYPPEMAFRESPPRRRQVVAGRAAAVKRPASVTWAFRLWVAATGVGLGGAFALIADHRPDVPSWGDPAAAGGMVAAIGTLLAIWAFARLAFAWFLLRGGAWARIVLTGLAWLGFATVAFHADHVSVLSWLAVALNAIAVVLQFTPAANAYFAACAHRDSSVEQHGAGRTLVG